MSDYWYALQVRPRFERLVKVHLEEKGFPVFYPTYSVSRHWSDRVKHVTLPLFPGYVFSKFDVQARLPILVTPGVNQVVGAGKTPIRVEEDELDAIRRVIESGVAAQPWPYLKIGETVRIETGPLEGLTGIVTRIRNEFRLIVSVSLLMRSVAVEVDRDAIKPVLPMSGLDGIREQTIVAKAQSLRISRS